MLVLEASFITGGEGCSGDASLMGFGGGGDWTRVGVRVGEPQCRAVSHGLSQHICRIPQGLSPCPAAWWVSAIRASGMQGEGDAYRYTDSYGYIFMVTVTVTWEKSAGPEEV